ncbi:hypothetical protein ANN_25983 [Periplaneta americana]|uniref:HAT C-terminal dimerisation domain-containing protein n=1 Tax=Periplaneta americana TaxID=6978 RepID=A0ABQ8S527_PERAM|nr:hypothetical protein ANN_25983 [Periplaneta americana]
MHIYYVLSFVTVYTRPVAGRCCSCDVRASQIAGAWESEQLSLSTVCHPITDMNKYVQVLEELSQEFDCRFQEFANLQSGISIFATTFSVNIDSVPSSLQLKVIDLQNDIEMKDRFENKKDLSTFYRRFPQARFPRLHRFAARMLSIFGSTYVCEQFFSCMKICKSQHRNHLSDLNLKHILRLCVSQIMTPNIAKLVREKRGKNLDKVFSLGTVVTQSDGPNYHMSRAVASWSKASYLGLTLRNARWFQSSWGKKFSHEISTSVWDRCPPSIMMHLGSYDRCVDFNTEWHLRTIDFLVRSKMPGVSAMTIGAAATRATNSFAVPTGVESWVKQPGVGVVINYKPVGLPMSTVRCDNAVSAINTRAVCCDVMDEEECPFLHSKYLRTTLRQRVDLNNDDVKRVKVRIGEETAEGSEIGSTTRSITYLFNIYLEDLVKNYIQKMGALIVEGRRMKSRPIRFTDDMAL